MPILSLKLPRTSDPLPVLSLYADDTSVIPISDDATKAVCETYDKFEKGSGFKLNLSWTWTSVKIKVLGVVLGPGQIDDLNWAPRLEGVEKCLDYWRSRS